MRILIITQDEPFYLAENIEYLARILPKNANIVACVVTDVSPFGRKERFYRKAFKTFEIFGLTFFLYYSCRFLWRKVVGRGGVSGVLRDLNIQPVYLSNSINHPDSISRIADHKPDLLVTILGNEIFRKELIKLAPKGCINLHTALLPQYRGLMPTFWVLRFDEKETGVSVFFVDEGIDSGPIIVQKRILIGDASQEELIRRTKRLGMEALAEAVDAISREDVVLMSNNVTEGSYYSFPSRRDVKAFLAIGKKFF